VGFCGLLLDWSVAGRVDGFVSEVSVSMFVSSSLVVHGR
jgi:hypothetical protein